MVFIEMRSSQRLFSILLRSFTYFIGIKALIIFKKKNYYVTVSI
jgi:hypothetical protein